MNFQQLRSIREAARRGFNLTEVADALHTSQPGVSRQIRELEDELGMLLFVRAGRRLTGLTEAGATVMPIIEALLTQAENLRRAADDYQQADKGILRLAATHTQARYALPPVIRDFRERYPDVQLQLHQGSPTQIAQLLLEDKADIGIATEALAQYEALAALPAYVWTHLVIMPPGHHLAAEPRISLEQLSREPLITYDPGYTGRTRIDAAFAKAGLSHRIVLEAMDSDVIKTYVELGLGVGIIASLAHDPERDVGIEARDARHLFEPNTTRIALRRGLLPRGYMFEFIRMFAPPLDRASVEAALQEDPVDR